jgi:paraquat-inducible protein A
MPVIICPACDLVHRAAPVRPQRTRCVRCRATLQRAVGSSIDSAISLAICALILFLFSNLYPLVAMNFNGTTRDATLLDTTLGFYRQGHPTLAAIVFVTTILGPLIQIAILLYLLVPLRNGRLAPGTGSAYRFLTHVRPWTLVEVFMLGSVVALVRVAKYAQVLPGVALWSYALLMLTLAALTHRTSPEQFWRWTERSIQGRPV